MLQRAREWWEGQSRNNQIIFVASSLGVLVALFGFIFWAGQPEYQLLFDNLAPQDASAISDKLKEQNVPFRLAAGGKAIEVPAQKRDEMRMQLLAQNLPHQSNATIGNAVLDTIGPMTTDKMEQQKLLQAREGEVSKTIMSMEQVASATVHYGEADTSLFANGNKQAKASVILSLKSGMSLTKENVKAIVRLTQMPLAGLQENNITVSDSLGNLLWDGPGGGENNMGDFMEKTRAYASELRAELQSALDRVVGKGNAIVLAHPEMNYDTETVKRVIPEAGIATSKTTDVETFKGEGGLNRSAVGATANANGTANAPTNTPGTPNYVSSNNTDGEYNHEQNQTTFLPGQSETVTTKAPMRLERLTVSAMIDSNVKLSDGKAVDVAAIKQVLENHIATVGNTAARSVSVVLFPFNRSEELAADKAAAAAAAAERMQRTTAIAVPLVLMVVCFVLLSRAMKKSGMIIAPGGEQLALAGAGMGGAGMLDYSSLNAPEGTTITLPDGTIVDASEYMVGPDGTLIRRTDDTGEPIGLLTGDTGGKTYDVIEQQFDGVLESILHMARNKPEMVGALIKTWVSEEG